MENENYILFSQASSNFSSDTLPDAVCALERINMISETWHEAKYGLSN